MDFLYHTVIAFLQSIPSLTLSDSLFYFSTEDLYDSKSTVVLIVFRGRPPSTVRRDLDPFPSDPFIQTLGKRLYSQLGYSPLLSTFPH